MWRGMRPYRHHPPPWWPTGEPWPPRHRRQWRPPSHALGASQRFAGRRFFLIRLAALLVIVLALSAFGAVTLLMTAFGRGSPGQLSGYVLWAVVPALFVYGLVLTMRLVGQPLSDVDVDADRVPSGHIGLTVLGHGPPDLRPVPPP